MLDALDQELLCGFGQRPASAQDAGFVGDDVGRSPRLNFADRQNSRVQQVGSARHHARLLTQTLKPPSTISMLPVAKLLMLEAR